MKKIFMVLLAVLVALCCSCESKSQPEPEPKQIRGIVVDVKQHPRKSSFGIPAFTTIKFKDGRVVNFFGIYMGDFFQEGKCQIIYPDSDWKIIRVEKCDPE